MGLIFRSHRNEFNRKNMGFQEYVKSRMGFDMEQILKTSSGMPVKFGNMKSQTRHFKTANGGVRVEVDVEYASYQEAGVRRDGTHRVRKYTTAGTSAGFFKRSIDKVWKNRDSYIAEAKRAFNL